MTPQIPWPIPKKDLMTEFYLTREQGQPTARFGAMMLLMAEQYATKPCWCGYPCVDEFVGNGVLNLMNAWKHFKPEESSTANIFGYFTACLHNSFIRTLSVEKKQWDILAQERIFAGADASWNEQAKRIHD